MTTDLSFIDKLEHFAQTSILNRPDLGQTSQFPEDIRMAMGEQGLLDPWALGCLTGDGKKGSGFCRDLTAGARGLVASGGCLGIALSWVVHHLVVRYLVFSDLGGVVAPDLKHRIQSGRTTICFAVSEPDAGAHPKYMTATAQKEEHGFLINGSKAFLTNGPIAGVFLVVAITGQSKGKKKFSAFLVDRNTSGLTVGEPMEIPFFKPCPHGRIKLENCRVDDDALVGVRGQAFDAMVLPFRTVEDAVMTGAAAGAMVFILDSAAARLKGMECLDPYDIQTLGALKAQVDAAGFLSCRIASLADQSGLQEYGILDSLIMHFKQSVTLFLDQVKALYEKNGCPSVPPEAILHKDLALSFSIAKKSQATRQKKMGDRLLQEGFWSP